MCSGANHDKAASMDPEKSETMSMELKEMKLIKKQLVSSMKNVISKQVKK